MSDVVIWFITGALLFVAELMSPVFVMFFFGLGAWAAGLMALFTDSPALEVLVFCTVTVVLSVSLRRGLVRSFRGRVQLSSDKAAEGAPDVHDGKLGVVTRSIPSDGVGEVALGGSFWRAVSSGSVAEGTRVRVLGHVPDEELTLRVIPCERNDQPR